MNPAVHIDDGMDLDEEFGVEGSVSDLNSIISDNQILSLIFQHVPMANLLRDVTLVCRRWHNIVLDQDTMGNELLWRSTCFLARDFHDQQFRYYLTRLGEHWVNMEWRFSSKVKPETKYRFLDICGPHLRQFHMVGHMTSELFLHRLLVECRSLRHLSLEPQFFDRDKKQSMKHFRFHMDDYIRLVLEKSRTLQEMKCKREEEAAVSNSNSNSSSSSSSSSSNEIDGNIDNRNARIEDLFDESFTDMSLATGAENEIAVQRAIDAMERNFCLPHLSTFELNVSTQFSKHYVKKLVGYVVEHASNLQRLALHVSDESCLELLTNCSSSKLSNLYLELYNCKMTRPSPICDIISRFLISGLHVLTIIGTNAVPLDLLVRFIKDGANTLRFFQLDLQQPIGEEELERVGETLSDTDLLEGRVVMRRLRSFRLLGTMGDRLPLDLFSPLLSTLHSARFLRRRTVIINDERLRSLWESIISKSRIRKCEEYTHSL